MKYRKVNKAKEKSKACRNHGSCHDCRSSRLYSNTHRASVLSIKEQLNENSVQIY